MSYRNYNLGVHLPVSCKDGLITIKFYTGEESFKTTLSDNFKEQVLFFNLPENVLFVAEDNDIRYVGREDGSISGYRISDNVLVKIATWNPPPMPQLKLAGYVNNTGVQPVYVDEVRKKILYLKDNRAEFNTKEDFKFEVNSPASLGRALYGKGYNLSIVTVNNEEVDSSEIGHWVIQAYNEKPAVRGIF